MKGPVFTKEPLNRIDFSNSTGAVVECRASGNPPPEIIWIRSDSGTAVGDVPGLRQVLSNGNLVFPPFRAEDYRQEVHAQVYACMAKNSIGSIISRDVHVRAGKKIVFHLHFSVPPLNNVKNRQYTGVMQRFLPETDKSLYKSLIIE